MGALAEKLKEVLFSVIPVVIIVLILNFTIVPLESTLFIKFIIGAVFITLGLTLFLLGVESGVTIIGNKMGEAITKTNKLWIVLIAGLILGFFVSIAEPDLHIVAEQVDLVSSGSISKWSIVLVVSIGIAIMLAVGMGRILYSFPLFKLLTILYGIILILSILSSKAFLAISFDSSGATTGALTVPFIMALAVGVSRMKKDSKASEKDSFGLIGVVSTGAIIAVMVMSIFSGSNEITGTLGENISSDSIIQILWYEFRVIGIEIIVALLPILFLFLIFQKISFKINFRELRKIGFGLLFTYVGLVVFLVGVNTGFMKVGNEVGYKIATMDNKGFVIIVGFLLGIVTIMAEPAVYVLTNQIEDVTSGYVKRKVVLFTLAIGVGFAIAFSVIRILIPDLQLWQFLLPGYMMSIALTYISPKLFVGIAFDSGGVASGPMTATFILAYTQGVAKATPGVNVMVDGFGVIAMVAMAPLISLQILGVIFRLKSRKGGLYNR